MNFKTKFIITLFFQTSIWSADLNNGNDTLNALNQLIGNNNNNNNHNNLANINGVSDINNNNHNTNILLNNFNNDNTESFIQQQEIDFFQHFFSDLYVDPLLDNVVNSDQNNYVLFSNDAANSD